MGRDGTPQTVAQSIRLPAQPESAARARDFVRGVLRRSPDPDVVDAAALCVTELVANVSMHTESPECTVTVEDSDESVTIEVADEDPGLPAVEHLDIDSEHGRGLLIVATLAAEWGVKRTTEHRKSVWLRLPDGSRLEGRSPLQPSM